MGDFVQKRSFEKAFKQAVINFDEKLIWFEYTKRYGKQLVVCFVYENQLRRVPMYQSQYEIDEWANHFIDFLNTGIFDMHFYVSIYNDNSNIDKIQKFPFGQIGKNEFYDHSPESFKFLDDYRKNINKNVGMRTVAKPL